MDKYVSIVKLSAPGQEKVVGCGSQSHGFGQSVVPHVVGIASNALGAAQYLHPTVHSDFPGRLVAFARDHAFLLVVNIHLKGRSHLSLPIYARDAARLRLGLAQCGQEQPGQNRDDGDHDEQFDQGESAGGCDVFALSHGSSSTR